jgi:hypothetical protein
VARVLPTAFVAALLAATAGAFALTEKAKNELPRIYATHVAHVFSPDCGANCPTRVADIDFTLRKRDRVAVWVIRDGKRVATIVPGREYPARSKIHLAFTGIADNGKTLPDGSYQPVVDLIHAHEQITLPNTIVLDTTPPHITLGPHRRFTVLSPDGDHHNDRYVISYKLSEPAHGILYVDGTRVEFTHGERRSGVLVWDGKVHGRPARPGKNRLYVLSISARDLAHNETQPYPFAQVQIRYVALGRTRILVQPHHRFHVFVNRDAPAVHWIFHGREGTSREPTLVLRAPKAPGVYRLYVQVGDHTAKADVVVG